VTSGPTPAPLDPAWYEAIKRRVSRRDFDGTELLTAHFAGLESFPDAMPQAPGARLVLLRSAPPELFKGIVGSYGSVRHAPSAAAFVAAQDADTSAGYLGEAFVLQATMLDLNTCWLAGSFDRSVAARVFGELASGERVVAVTPVGHAVPTKTTVERFMGAVVQSGSRRRVDEIAPTLATEDWPGWAVVAVEAARRAPSGANRQPWRFRMDDGALVLYSVKDTYRTAALDLGIAMVHAQLGAEHAGAPGRWERLDAPDVARWVPAGGMTPCRPARSRSRV
jgi:nitroreductase